MNNPRKKILFVTNELKFSCGTTRHLQNLSLELTDRGYEVTILTGGDEAAVLFNNPGIKVIKKRYLRHENRSRINFLQSVIYLAFYTLLNKNRIVHSHTHYAANIAYKASGFGKFATVQTVHGLFFTPSRLTKYMADYYTAVSENVFDELITKNIPEAKISLIRSGINFPENLPEKTKTGTIRAVCVSRLIPEKGIDTLIRAAALIKPEVRSKIEIIIAGDGPFEPELKRLNEELNSGVIFKGPVTDTEELYRCAHFAVIPTKLDTEGFPMTVIEAAAFGCLVISSGFLSIRGLLENGKDGYLFPGGDHRALAAVLENAVLNREKNETFVINFRNKLKQRYDIKENVNKLTGLYETIR